jgi:hypothetical protein
MTDHEVSTYGEQKPSVPASLDSEFTSFAGQLYVPKLSAKQVLLWLILVVALIGLDFGISAIGTREIQPLQRGTVTALAPWWTRIIWRFIVVSFAACLVTSGFLIRSRCFRTLGRLQPGHWIVLILATSGILERITRPFYLLRFAYPSPHGWAQHTSEAMMWFNILVLIVLFAFAAICLRDAKRWKVLLVSGSAYPVVCYLPIILNSLSMGFTGGFVQVWRWSLPCCSALLVVIALVAVFIDWPRRATRDWPHWLGVSLWTLGSLGAGLNSLMNVWRWAGP